MLASPIASECWKTRLRRGCLAGLLYDWLYPAHFPALRCSLQAWAGSPEVANIILKFLAEFVWNKTSRLSFDSCSANGILLFREISQVVFCAHSRALQGMQILEGQQPEPEPSPESAVQGCLLGVAAKCRTHCFKVKLCLSCANTLLSSLCTDLAGKSPSVCSSWSFLARRSWKQTEAMTPTLEITRESG